MNEHGQNGINMTIEHQRKKKSNINDIPQTSNYLHIHKLTLFKIILFTLFSLFSHYIM